MVMIPEAEVGTSPSGQRPLSIVYIQTLGAGCDSWLPPSVFSAGKSRSSVDAWYSTSLDIEEAVSGVVDGEVHLFVADVVTSFDAVDRNILDCVLSSLGLPGWFRHVYFEYHARVYTVQAGGWCRRAVDSGWWDPPRGAL